MSMSLPVTFPISTSLGPMLAPPHPSNPSCSPSTCLGGNSIFKAPGIIMNRVILYTGHELYTRDMTNHLKMPLGCM